jgi:peptidoglycan/LPS O-acetylase OafA/YrhL
LPAAWLLHKLIETPLSKVLKRKLAESSVRPRDDRARASSGPDDLVAVAKVSLRRVGDDPAM